MLRTPQRALFVADRILTIYHGNGSPEQKKCLKNGAGMWTTGWMKRESNIRHSSNDCPHFNPLSLMAFFNHRKPFLTYLTGLTL